MPRKRTDPSAGTNGQDGAIQANCAQAGPVQAGNVQASNAQTDSAPYAPTGSVAAATQPASAIDQALALKESLRVLLARTDELVRALKQQKKRETLVESTLASLKQLQNAA